MHFYIIEKVTLKSLYYAFLQHLKSSSKIIFRCTFSVHLTNYKLKQQKVSSVFAELEIVGIKF